MLSKLSRKKMVAISIVTLFFISIFVGLINFSGVNALNAGTSSTVTTSTSSAATSYSGQRHTFYANGLFWDFYSDGTNISYATSSNASIGSWTTNTLRVNGTSGTRISVWYNGTYVFYVASGGAGGGLNFRCGTPLSNGSITWVQPEQLIYSDQSGISWGYPSVVVDDTGHYWVAVVNSTASPYSYIVIESSTTDGTWTNSAGFPYTIPITNLGANSFQIVPLTNGKIVFDYYNHTDGWQYFQSWSGSSWNTPVNCQMSAYSASAVSLVSSGDNVYASICNTTADIAYSIEYYYSNNSFGTPQQITSDHTGPPWAMPALTIDASNNLYAVWENGSTQINYAMYNSTTSSWGTTANLLTTVNLVQGNTPYSSFYQLTNNYIGISYLNGTGSPYSIEYDYLTGFPSSDITSPTYSTPTTNTTVAGANCNFTVSLADNVALANYTFGCNVTGAWVNDTTVSTGTIQSILAKANHQLPYGIGKIVQWEVWFADSSNNLNNTGVQSLTTTLGSTLTYSNLSVNQTVPESQYFASMPTNFNCGWTDSAGLSGYIFGTNNTGSWVNDTWTSFSTNPQVVTATLTLDSNVGDTVAYEWWGNNTSNEWNNTGLISISVVSSGDGSLIDIGQWGALHAPMQTKTFFASGRYWVIYESTSNGGDNVFSSSTDGVTWTAPTDLQIQGVQSGVGISVCNVNSTIYWADSYDSNVFFRQGTLNSDGTITWAAAVQTAYTIPTGNGTQTVWGGLFPTIAVNSNGQPYIAFTVETNNNGGHYSYNNTITASSNTNGIWSTMAGFPYMFSSMTSDTYSSLESLANGDVYLAFYTSMGSNTHMNGYLINGSSLGSIETFALNNTLYYSMTSYGNNIYLLFTNATDNSLYFTTRTYGVGWNTAIQFETSTLYSSYAELSVDSSNGNLYAFYAYNNTIYCDYSTNDFSTRIEMGEVADGTNQLLEPQWNFGYDGIQITPHVTNGKIGLLFATGNATLMAQSEWIKYLVISPYTLTYRQITYSTTTANAYCTFSSLWQDANGLSGSIFSINTVGTWINYTWTPFNTNPAFAITSTTLPASGTVYFKWYCNDSSNNWENTGIQSFQVTASSVNSGNSGTNTNSNMTTVIYATPTPTAPMQLSRESIISLVIIAFILILAAVASTVNANPRWKIKRIFD